MDRKALFLDLDGTLLNDHKEITPGNRAAISKTLLAGHKIIINTGRPLISALKQAQALHLDGAGCYLAAYNGGVLYDMERRSVISKVSIPVELVTLTFEEANRRNIHIQTYSDTKVLVEPRCDDNEVRRYCELINMTYQVIPNIRELVQEPVKILLINYQDPAPLEEFRKWINSWADTLLDAFFSCNEYVEIVSKGLNKGNALRQMAALLHVPLENTVAAGDAQNDLPMIQAAHIGVCMRNGCKECKEAADYVTVRDNNSDGIAEMIEKFILMDKN